MNSIRATSLTKRYGDTTAVDSLDLTVPNGIVYGFLGPNGAGKTTTMRMLTTLIRPTSGQAFVGGESITDRNAVTTHIGYLPEEPPLYPELTAYEQLDYAAGLRDIATPETTNRIETLLDRLDLTGDADDRIVGYSKGMRQKTAFIQAILHDPDVLFLDEPTSGLDPRSARTVRDIIIELTNNGTTVFLSTHILPIVDELADTVGVLFDGQLITEGSPAELKRRAESGEQDTLEDVFLEVTDDESAFEGESNDA
ncbi:multidrug ABC transporter ATP-binding protein [Haladaptatus sp. R4]|uniref:ABC transporter ATP-binding protein n=1 Tax=Haladaptatus sp. R4 TaxID=1679489 RepID=UPI0007B4853F|nr:ABC transporter ATP-binding protein [Haladaptatus sp. R4]KZN22561.1 multidrug ABC transporter ATP-binding protein [Haladaptatus sp. R4]